MKTHPNALLIGRLFSALDRHDAGGGHYRSKAMRRVDKKINESGAYGLSGRDRC